MPLTFLCHQAVVLPLKIAAPRATSGTALVLGSMAPDVEYFLRGYPTSVVSHTWMGQLTFCLPVTLVLYWVVTRVVAEPAGVHAPEGGDLHLPEYALIAQQPTGLRHWAIVGASALIGSASHIVLDRVGDGWTGMPYHALAATPARIAVNVALWMVLGIVTLLLMRYIGRRGLVRRWVTERARTGSAPAQGLQPQGGRANDRGATPRHSGRFWGWVFLSGVTGAVLGALFRASGFMLHEPATWVHIWLCAVSASFTGLVLASAVWHGAVARSVQLRGTE